MRCTNNNDPRYRNGRSDRDSERERSVRRQKRKRRRALGRLLVLLVIFLLAIIISLVVISCNRTVFKDNTSDAASATIVSKLSYAIPDKDHINFVNENVNTLYANSAYLYNITDDKVLYAKNIHDVLYPASTTKVLTAYCAFKYGKLSDRLTVSENCVDLEPGASICGFRVGDHPTLEQALYGLMICSGNDAAIAIAEHISGSVEKFADLMNKEAVALGAENTHFLNPHGLHEEDHYTTPYDLFLIFRELVKNDKLMEILSHAHYTTDVEDGDGGTRSLTWGSTNRYLTDSRFRTSTVTVLGTKTGYTNEAGSCLVTLAEDTHGKKYISVIMKTTDPGTVFLETTDMYNTLVKK